MAKKKSVKARPKKAAVLKKKHPKHTVKKAIRTHVTAAQPIAAPVPHEPKPDSAAVQEMKHEADIRAPDIFHFEQKETFGIWWRKYKPVIITTFIGLVIYFWIVFYLFFPTALLEGHYIQLLVMLLVVFFIAGILIYTGTRSEVMAVRILSFIFVFVIFSLVLVFLLIAHAMQ